MRQIRKSGSVRGWGQRIHGWNNVAPPGNQAVNGENKHQPKYLKKPVYSTQNQKMASQ
jgi:hypothetical protein